MPAYGVGAYGAGPYGVGLALPYTPVDTLGRVPDLRVEIDATNPAASPGRAWTDVTSRVRTAQWQRGGRNDELQRSEAGTLTATLDDRDGRLASLAVAKGQWVRVRARWQGVEYPRWQGIIDTVTREWPGSGTDATVTIRASGPYKILRLYYLDGAVFPPQRGDQRVAAVLALAGLPVGSLDTDTDTIDAYTAATGTDALSHLLQVEESEGGLLVEGPDGTVGFQGRHWRSRYASAAKATIGDQAGQIPYRDTASYEDTDAYIYNDIRVSYAGGNATATAANPDSQSKYFARRLSRTLLVSSDSLAASAAQWLAFRYGDPPARLPQLDVHLAAAAAVNPAHVAALLGLGVSDRLTWWRSNPAPVHPDVHVERITEEVTPGLGWRMTLACSPAASFATWALGDAANSILGSTTRLDY